ncbi:PBSX family phage terminase large subunit [Sphingomonas montanisoli]|uniref:PBSX family phage terminase large subunit n=1 Tax=Sphingomonas montanisoli TaxID=2606412 RepID=A0A5D9C2E3_9SPHN|nr:phage terminase large subunit [Sphingomonas montanisoli]TZG25593.1 PBSX family phage terminase large subunit [Sphingomonas montanisoli]
MTEATIELPPKLVPVFAPERGTFQYRNLHGGRGSGKSFNAAKMAAIWGYAEPLRILCTREFQVSISESFHAELKAAIASEPWLEAHYDVGVDYLRGANGTHFLFRGLRRNVQSVKSLAKIDLTIVEEAEDVPETSWLALEATVFRQPKSELWALWNPRLEGSPVDMRFRKHPPDNAITAEVNHFDNPFFPAGLDKLRRREQERLDPATYHHVWEGGYLVNSDAQVLAGKWRVQEFEPKDSWDGPYQGGDFGYAQDPTAAVRCYIHGDTLYISHEAGGRGIELDAIGAKVSDAIPGYADYVSRWDSASPGSISILTRSGLRRAEPAPKWQGSVDDGIRFLRSFREIVIHPRCKATISEARLYSYKVDRLTGDVLPVLVDANNHYIDAVRYAVSPLIKQTAYNASAWLS